MTGPAPSGRRWFRFSLRTGFVLLTLFCVWLGVQVKWIRDRHEAIDWVSTQAEVWHDVPVSQRAHLGTDAPWQVRILGATGVEQISVVVDKNAVAAKQQELEQLFPEANVLVLTPGPGYGKRK